MGRPYPSSNDPNSPDFNRDSMQDPGHTHSVSSAPGGFPVGGTGLTGATAATRYAGGTVSGAPVSGTFAVGDFVIDESGAVWICTVAGTPGTWVMPGVAATVAKPVSIIDNSLGPLQYTPVVNTVGTSRIFSTVGIAASQLRLLFVNWCTYPLSQSSVTDQDTYNSMSAITFNASIEVVSTGVIYRVTFNGAVTGALGPGGQIVSDPVAIDVAPGTQLAVRTFLASGSTLPRQIASYKNGEGFTATTDLTAPGSAAVTQSFAYVYGPATILGMPAAANPLSVLWQGDSIAMGNYDGTQGGLGGGFQPGDAAKSYGGYLTRALHGVGGIMLEGVNSDSLNQYTAPAGHNRRGTLAQYARYAFISYGVNDIFGLSATAAATEALLILQAQRNAALGIYKTFVGTLCPYTTSTDMWLTTTNQTSFNSTDEIQRVAYNTWIRAGCPVNASTLAPVAVGTGGALLAGQARHPIAGFFDTASYVESSLNSGLWAPPPLIVTDAAITASSYTITCATSQPFVNAAIPTVPANGSAMVTGGSSGLCICLPGATGQSAPQFITYASSTTAAQQGPIFSTTQSGLTMGIGVMTNDGLHPTNGHALMANAITIADFV